MRPPVPLLLLRILNTPSLNDPNVENSPPPLFLNRFEFPPEFVDRVYDETLPLTRSFWRSVSSFFFSRSRRVFIIER